jgi:hypothetical protein
VSYFHDANIYNNIEISVAVNKSRGNSNLWSDKRAKQSVILQ